MSVYTTQIRWILESGETLSLNSYPIFEDSYRAQLNQKIIDHFYFREIGFETVALFNNRLAARMNEIMPYFNQLYQSALLTIDPFVTKKYSETFQRHAADDIIRQGQETRDDTNQGTSGVVGHKNDQETASSSSAGSSKTVGSNTPQGLLAAENIDSDLYASTATLAKTGETDSSTHAADEWTNTQTTSEGKASSDVTRSDKENVNKWEQFTRSLTGFDGASQSDLLLKFRETFLNIDMQVIDALEDLFMQIW